VKVTSENLPDRQVKLQIEVDGERHAEAMEQAYKRLAPRVQIKGFRPGKAPRPLIEKQLGHHRLLDEAMDILVPEAYKAALEEQSITPVASPEVELVSHEPLVFTATVPLEPAIDLGDYLGKLRLPRESVTVSDDEVEQELEELRHRYGTVEPVDRPAQKGDVIRGSLNASTEDDNVFSGQEIEYHLDEDYLISMPGLMDAVIGMSKGDESQATTQVPDDFPDERLRGHELTYRIIVKEIKEEKLAELNDEFAKTVGEGFDNLKALREHIREDLQKKAESASLGAYESAAVDALTEMAQLEYAPVMLEHEIDHVLEGQANLDPRDPTAQQLYIERIGKSEEEVRESVRADAERRLRRSLVISEFAKAENISVTDADVEQELQDLFGEAGEQAQVFRQMFDNDIGRDHLRQNLLTRRTLGRLVEIAGADAPAKKASRAKAPAAAATTKAPAKSRRAAPRKVAEEVPEAGAKA
jgi:trigger factor